MQSRRTILRTLSAATALVAAPQVHAGRASSLSHSPPWWLLNPMDVGTDLGADWSLASLGPIIDGAAIIVLSHPEQGEVRIHLCLHEGAPKGFAHTDLFDLIVIDHGRGIRPVPKDLAPALLKLGKTTITCFMQFVCHQL